MDNRITFSNKQKEWLSEYISCVSYNLIPKPAKPNNHIITQTLFAGFYYESERIILNTYLKKYPLPLLQRLLRERK